MEKLSRTQKKKAAQALQKKGEQLVALSDADFALLEIPDELKQAVAEARRITSHEARRRQLQYVGRLMREFDSETIDRALEKIASREEARRRQFRMVERWRDELAGGDDARRQWLLATYPQIDAQRLDRLVLAARRPGVKGETKAARRKLFKFLSQLDTDVAMT